MKKRELSSDEKEEIKEYSENNKYLYEALSSCWENGIRTHACCSGHIHGGTPYIAMLIDSESLPYIKKIIAKLQDVKDITMNSSIRHNKDGVLPESECKSFIIYGQRSNRCELFYKIGQAIQEEKDIEITDQRAIRFYKSIESMNNMSYDEILKGMEEQIVIGSGFSNISQDLIEYRKANNWVEKIKRIPLIKSILEKFSPQTRKNNEIYSMLENRYGNMQNDYKPSLQERVAYQVNDEEKEEATKEDSRTIKDEEKDR